MSKFDEVNAYRLSASPCLDGCRYCAHMRSSITRVDWAGQKYAEFACRELFAPDVLEKVRLLKEQGVRSIFNLHDIPSDTLFSARLAELSANGSQFRVFIESVDEEFLRLSHFLEDRESVLEYVLPILREHEILKIMNKLPVRVREKLHFYFAEKKKPNDSFLSEDEMDELLALLHQSIPGFAPKLWLPAKTRTLELSQVGQVRVLHAGLVYGAPKTSLIIYCREPVELSTWRKALTDLFELKVEILIVTDNEAISATLDRLAQEVLGTITIKCLNTFVPLAEINPTFMSHFLTGYLSGSLMGFFVGVPTGAMVKRLLGDHASETVYLGYKETPLLLLWLDRASWLTANPSESYRGIGFDLVEIGLSMTALDRVVVDRALITRLHTLNVEQSKEVLACNIRELYRRTWSPQVYRRYFTMLGHNSDLRELIVGRNWHCLRVRRRGWLQLMLTPLFVILHYAIGIERGGMKFLAWKVTSLCGRILGQAWRLKIPFHWLRLHAWKIRYPLWPFLKIYYFCQYQYSARITPMMVRLGFINNLEERSL